MIWRSACLVLHTTRRAMLLASDQQAAWENPRQCGKPAGGTQTALSRLQSGNFARHKKHQLSSMFTVG